MGAGAILCVWAISGIAQPSAYVVDGDADGVADEVDRCLYSRPGERVDRMGCAATDDADYDGIPDEYDFCPDTPDGAAVDAFGCIPPPATLPPAGSSSDPDADADADGVAGTQDQCPYSEAGAWVDAQGCALDTDLDGVADGRDYCPESRFGAVVNTEGCARGERRVALPERAATQPVPAVERSDTEAAEPAPTGEGLAETASSPNAAGDREPSFATQPASVTAPLAALPVIPGSGSAGQAPISISAQDKLERLLSAIAGATATAQPAASAPPSTAPEPALPAPPMAEPSPTPPATASAAPTDAPAGLFLSVADADLRIADLAQPAEVAAWGALLQAGARLDVQRPVPVQLPQLVAAPPMMPLASNVAPPAESSTILSEPAESAPADTAAIQQSPAPAPATEPDIAAAALPVTAESPAALPAADPLLAPSDQVLPPPVVVAEIPDLPVRVVPQPVPVPPIPVAKLSRDVRFVRGSVELDGAIMAKLRERLPDWERALEQHASNQLKLIGSQRDDQELTSTRSQVVRAFLMAMGIAPRRISIERGVVNDANLRIEVGGLLE